MKNLTWQNPEQLFVAQVLINKVKSKCCGIKGQYKSELKEGFLSDFEEFSKTGVIPKNREGDVEKIKQLLLKE